MTPTDLAHLAEHMTRHGIGLIELACDGRQYRLVADAAPPSTETQASTPATEVIIVARMPGRLRTAHPARDRAEIEPGMQARAGQIVAYLEAADLFLPVVSPIDGVAGAWRVPSGTIIGYGCELLSLVRSA